MNLTLKLNDVDVENLIKSELLIYGVKITPEEIYEIKRLIKKNVVISNDELIRGIRKSIESTL